MNLGESGLIRLRLLNGTAYPRGECSVAEEMSGSMED